MEKKENKKPYTAPEVQCIAMEKSGLMVTSNKTSTHILLEEYSEEEVTPTTTGGNTFNVW